MNRGCQRKTETALKNIIMALTRTAQKRKKRKKSPQRLTDISTPSIKTGAHPPKVLIETINKEITLVDDHLTLENNIVKDCVHGYLSHVKDGSVNDGNINDPFYLCLSFDPVNEYLIVDENSVDDYTMITVNDCIFDDSNVNDSTINDDTGDKHPANKNYTDSAGSHSATPAVDTCFHNVINNMVTTLNLPKTFL
ncbi:hypothetical protein NDU88_005401 [Pleurodeles waltl]|uniref:Uncharacterized protein n=1 Tax=Pleurodeles waltl TaxID=8319 RepID=A0AAV7MC02_PLEWA|nr:hypothetical protein NDU88_005401 [Pleurodeles waltl]